MKIAFILTSLLITLCAFANSDDSKTYQFSVNDHKVALIVSNARFTEKSAAEKFCLSQGANLAPPFLVMLMVKDSNAMDRADQKNSLEFDFSDSPRLPRDMNITKADVSGLIMWTDSDEDAKGRKAEVMMRFNSGMDVQLLTISELNELTERMGATEKMTIPAICENIKP